MLHLISRSRLVCLFLVLLVAWSGLRVQAGDADAAATTPGGDRDGSDDPREPLSHRPKVYIYTYFERIHISDRTTGMTDDEDSNLLRFWKERWEEAGYTPVILTAENATFPQQLRNNNTNFNHHQSDPLPFPEERYESVRSKLDALPLDDFGKVLFRRWLAMASVGGGWFSDYDNFPLWNRSHDGEGGQELRQGQLHNGGKMTVHDILSPTLASGSGNEWLDTLDALLDEANHHCPLARRESEDSLDCFYTDSLSIHSLTASHHPLAPKTNRKVALPFDKNDPVSFDDPKLCSSKDFRTKHTIHFGPEALQRGRHVPPNYRLPKHRSRLAGDWLERWQTLCHKNVSINE